jgi:predicted MPP superfamily phosphohydrolase
MKYTWITDPHIDHLENDGFAILVDLIKANRSNGVILTGDITCAATYILILKRLHREIKIPIYFVLGNHDFYGSWIDTVRKAASMLQEQNMDLRYLTTQASPIELTPGVGLIGHDSWYDARYGDYKNSNVKMEDTKHINDFMRLTKKSLEIKLNELGTEAAEHLRNQLKLALLSYDQVILAMHVPPFREACLNSGEVIDDFHLPFYCCKTVGDVILQIMADASEKQLLVLCGHTHHEAQYQPLPNVKVLVGSAKYGKPRVQDTIEISG